MIEHWEVFVAVVIFGLGNGGLLLYALGSMKTTNNEHARRLDRHDGRITINEEKLAMLRTDVGTLRGRLEHKGWEEVQ